MTTAIATFGGFCAGTIVSLNKPGFSFRDLEKRSEWLDTSIIMAVLAGAALWAPSLNPRDPYRQDRFDDLPPEQQRPIAAVKVDRTTSLKDASGTGEKGTATLLPKSSPDEQKG